MVFGRGIALDFFMEQFKQGNIIIDSGMKEGSTRNYSAFRASKSFWHSLID